MDKNPKNLNSGVGKVSNPNVKTPDNKMSNLNLKAKNDGSATQKQPTIQTNVLTPETEKRIKMDKLALMQNSLHKTGQVSSFEKSIPSTLDRNQKRPSIEQKKITPKEVESKSSSNEVFVSKTKEDKKTNRKKRAIATTAIVMAAAATVVAPAIIYYKRNEEYEISIYSESNTFEAYSISLKRGATISTLKNKLNAFEGHTLVGIYKDAKCTKLFADKEKVTKDTKVYLKYEINTYTISLPSSNAIKKYVYSDTVDITAIPWGESFQFMIEFNEYYIHDEIIVKANGETLIPDEKGVYRIPFVSENIVVDVEGIEYLQYSIGTIPAGVQVKNFAGEVLQSNAKVDYGSKVVVSYTESTNHVMSSFSVNGIAIENNTEVVVDKDLSFAYSEVSAPGMSFAKVTGGYELEMFDYNVIRASIPTYVYNETVVSIGEGAFAGSENLAIIEIPETVSKIGAKAFKGCKNLTKINIPESVTIIDFETFDGCVNLTQLQLPSNLTSIGFEAFAGCVALETLELPSTVQSLAGSAFTESGLTSIEIPHGVTKISTNMFWGCKNLSTIILPETVTAYDKGAFGYCENLKKFTIPSYVESVHESTFDGCKLEELIIESAEVFKTAKFNSFANNHVIKVPVSLVEDENNADSNLNSREYIKLKTTDQYLYSLASMITNFNIPSGVIEIPENAFADLTGLLSVSVPNSVKKVNKNAFSGCVSLTDVYFESSSTIEEMGVDVFKGCVSLSSVTLPDSLTKIPSGTFNTCSQLANITLGNSLVEIGSYAFANCILNQIDLPATLKTISESAFENCNNLSTITIPAEVSEIQASAFAGCANLQKVTLEENTKLTSIENGVFANCVKLSKINFKEGLISIKENAFANCAFIGVELPNSLQTIGTQAFMGCQSLMAATIPAEVSEIQASAFADCPNLQNVTIEDNSQLSTISDSAFANCVNLAEINLQEGIMAINDNAFKNCALTQISLPNSLKVIGSQAFLNCKKLSTITILSGVETIEEGAFSGCETLKDITIESEEAYLNTVSNLFDYATNVKVIKSLVDDLDATNEILQGEKFVELISANHYVYDNIENVTDYVVPSDILTIPNEAFMNKTMIESVKIPSNVTQIGDRAFKGCSKLDTVIVPGTDTMQVGSYIFENCTGLVSINIPARFVGNIVGLFKGCTGLKSITIPTQITNFESICEGCTGLEVVNINTTAVSPSAFKGCTSLNQLTLNNLIESIGEDAFIGCEKLTNVTLPNALKTIGSRAFKGCEMLTYLTLPTSLQTINSSAFEGCKMITELTLPNSLQTIGENAFNGCNGLNSIKIESSVNEIDATSFAGCELNQIVLDSSTAFTVVNGTWASSNVEVKVLNSIVQSHTSEYLNADDFINLTDNIYKYFYVKDLNMTSFVVPDGVSEIENNLFQGFVNLQTVTLPSSVKTIGEYAFDGCSKLAQINLESVQHIKLYAFQNCSGLTAIDLSESLTLEANAFVNCSQLVTVADLSKVEQIGEYVFSNCLHLEEVNNFQNAQLTSIPNYAFFGCSSLTTIQLPATLTSVGISSFENCSDLTFETKPTQITNFGNRAFYNCGKVDVSITNNVTNIGDYAFANSGISGNLQLVKSITLGSRAFENCVKLTNVRASVLSEGAFAGCSGVLYVYPEVKEIPAHAFENCTGFNSISFSGETSIGAYAFAGCTSLREITNVNDLQTIGEYAFYGCSELQGLYHTEDMDGINESFSGFWYDLTSIGDYAFSGCKKLFLQGNCLGSVETIGECAFEQCSKLENIRLEADQIASTAFQNCGFSSIIIGSDAAYNALNGSWMGTASYVKVAKGYDAGTNSYLKQQYTTVLNGTSVNYYYTRYMSTVTIPSDVTIIPNNAFCYMIYLQNINIHNNVTSIGEAAFKGLTYLSNVTIPSSVVTIDKEAFFNCTALSSITLNEGTTSVGEYAFYNTGVKSITIPSGITFGAYAFAYSQMLESVVSESSVGAHMFDECSKLTTITLNGEEIGEYAFYNCRDLTSITLAYYQKIGDYAFAVDYWESEDSSTGETVPNLATDLSYVDLTNQELGENIFDNRVVSIVEMEVEDAINLGTSLKALKMSSSFSSYFTVDYLVVHARDSNYSENNSLKQYKTSNIHGGTYNYALPTLVDTISSYSLRTIAVINNIDITTAEDYNNEDTSWLQNAIQVTVSKEIVNDANNSNSYLTTENFIVFEDDEYYYYISKGAIDESVNYTQIVTYDGAVYVGTEDDPYHTFLYNE